MPDEEIQQSPERSNEPTTVQGETQAGETQAGETQAGETQVRDIQAGDAQRAVSGGPRPSPKPSERPQGPVNRGSDSAGETHEMSSEAVKDIRPETAPIPPPPPPSSESGEGEA
jgi:hypothetical protein